MTERGSEIRTAHSEQGENLHVAKVNAIIDDDGDRSLRSRPRRGQGHLEHAICPHCSRRFLHEKTMLLTLQNGFGNEEFLAEHFGAERVLGGLCFVCLNRVAPGVIEHYDYGHVVIGEFDRYPQPRTHDVAWEFKRCGVVCSVVENLALERWRKLVWNIPFNGLSVAGWRNRYRRHSCG